MIENHVGETTSIIFMAVALSMDAFSISLGLGMQQLRLKRVAIIGLVFGIFHILLPFIGIIIGKVLSVKIGQFAIVAGGFLLFGIGVLMILNAFTNDEIDSTIQPYGIGLLFLALSVSIDSFPVGLSLGMSGVKTALVLVLFGLFSTCVTWIGLLFGRKVRRVLGAYSEILGGSILLAFGLKIIFAG